MVVKQNYTPIISKPDKVDSKTSAYMYKKVNEQCNEFDKLTKGVKSGRSKN